ncbi:MAG: OmpA family protein [Elusimicrobiota bacterium]
MSANNPAPSRFEIKSDSGRNPQAGHSGHDLWIIPYADFMSVLMILFLMMFVFAYNSKTEKRYNEIISKIQQELGGTVKNEVMEEMREMERTEQTVMKFDEMVEKQNLSKLMTVSVDSEKIRLSMTTPVLFDSGKADLKNTSTQILHNVANILKTMENSVIVEGHTDNIPVVGGGRFKSNWDLSQARAIEVIKYFINTEGLNPSMFAAAGYGEYHPIFRNDTAENRERNRRIEINILRETENNK